MGVRFPAYLLLAVAAPAAAQVATQPGEVVAPPAPEADALAAQMRLLAVDPNNLDALLSAGELALQLGDPTAAAGFFARAESLDPRSGRLLAGRARLLLQAERPGEALRLFEQATGFGYPIDQLRADRALAYDLIGEQERAQRDYRLVLKAGDTPEVRRNYALSLGISGKRAEALAAIDPLVRAQDRAAWRVRAFILAMAGEPQEADRIATAMLPAPVASGLRPFFARLPQLGAIDRAFAVHFGELTPSPTRVADARLAPRLAPLPPEPVAVAAVPPAARPAPVQARPRRGRALAAIPNPTPPPVPAAPPMPPPPTLPTQLAAADPLPAPTRGEAPVAPLPTRSGATPAPRGAAPSPAGARPGFTVLPGAVPIPVATPLRIIARPSPAIAYTIARPPYVAPTSGAVLVRVATPAPFVAYRLATPPLALAAAAPPPATRLDEERERPARATPPPPKPLPPLKAPAKEAPAKPDPLEALAGKKPSAADLSAARKLAAKLAADERRDADKKDADKKGADKKSKADADKKDAKQPARFWVQVAGGATEDDLPKAWAAARAKAPLLKGRQGYTTPLRATNRVLTGPFKTRDEAQDFVNKLAGGGMSSFVFESAAGQKIDKLP
jgi:Flp pilus assembly protein TadD